MFESFLRYFQEKKWGVILLVLGTFLLYASVPFFQFLYFDDDFYVFENPYVLSGLSPLFFKWFLTATVIANWHPLTFLSHALDCQIFGLWAGGHHLTSLLFHTANSVLVFFIFSRITRSPLKSFFLAALFAWHPVKIESVAWVAERKDVLSVFFVLLALFFYTLYAQNKNRLKNFALCCFCFALSLLCKSMQVSFPLILLLLDIWPLERKDKNFGQRLIEKIPLALLSLLSCLIMYKNVSAAGSIITFQASAPFFSRLFEVGQTYAQYLKAFFLPFHLSPFYPAEVISHPLSGLLLTILLASFTFFLFIKRKAFSAAWIGWCFFLVSMVPVVGFVPVGSHSIACRYLYWPSLGLTFAVIWSIAQMTERKIQKRMLGWISVFVLALCIGISARDLPYWQNTYKLFYRSLELYPQENLPAHINLRSAYSRDGKREEAAIHLIEAMRLSPQVVEKFNVTWSDFYWMGQIFLKRGEKENALESFVHAQEMLASPNVILDEKEKTLSQLRGCVESIQAGTAVCGPPSA